MVTWYCTRYSWQFRTDEVELEMRAALVGEFAAHVVHQERPPAPGTS